MPRSFATTYTCAACGKKSQNAESLCQPKETFAPSK